MLQYAITDRRMFSGSEEEQQSALVAQASRLALAGVDYLQMREKDLGEAATVALAKRLLAAIHEAGGQTKLMLNGTAAMAQWAGADGVHLSSTTFAQNLQTHYGLTVSVSCHTLADVRRACEFADLILFAPVFEKRVGNEVVVEGVGLEMLRAACAAAPRVKVLAMGGVTWENAAVCVEAGAAGVAGIRLFG